MSRVCPNRLLGRKRAAQPAHLGVDAAVERGCGMAVRQIEQLIAAEHPLRTLDERNKENVFGGAERHDRGVIADELTPVRVQQPPAEPVLLRALGGAGGWPTLTAAPQDCPDARDELAATERLGQVVVSAELQTDDAVHLVALGGQHDDRDARLTSQAPTQ